MRVRAVLAVSFALGASAFAARADEDPHVRFRATMDSVFGTENWRITGGYRTRERENELRAQGALTVPAGRISRHSMGRPGAPGAYDVVVDGLSPFEAAAKLRRANAPFRTIFAERAHGSQGPHLHVDPYAGLGGGGFRAPGLVWTVADPTPAQQAVALLRDAALQGDIAAQLKLGQIYAEGRIERRDFIEAYVWTALAASNGAADPAMRGEADRALDVLAKRMKPEEVADAQRFAPRAPESSTDSQACMAEAGPDEPSRAVLIAFQSPQAPCAGSAAAPARAYGPIISRPRAAQAPRIAERGAMRMIVAAPATP